MWVMVELEVAGEWMQELLRWTMKILMVESAADVGIGVRYLSLKEVVRYGAQGRQAAWQVGV